MLFLIFFDFVLSKFTMVIKDLQTEHKEMLILTPLKVGLASLDEGLDALFDVFALHYLLQIG